MSRAQRPPWEPRRSHLPQAQGCQGRPLPKLPQTRTQSGGGVRSSRPRGVGRGADAPAARAGTPAAERRRDKPREPSADHPYPFSGVTRLPSGAHRSRRSWETLESKTESGQEFKGSATGQHPGSASLPWGWRRWAPGRGVGKGRSVAPSFPPPAPKHLPQAWDVKQTLTAGPSGPGGPSMSIPWKR